MTATPRWRRNNGDKKRIALVERVYLDYCAAAPLKPAARDAMLAAMERIGNPSSVHGHGRAARRMLEDAREAVAAMAGAAPANTVFTSGGTEANNLALRGFPGRRIVVSALEHDSALAAAGENALRIPATPDGVADLAALEYLLKSDDRPALVSLMLVNNETGVIQPVRQAAELVRAHGGLLHCDAAQAAGRLPLDLPELGCHLLSLSAHKLGGPAGIGALAWVDGAVPRPRLVGGGQERGVRAGTQNLIGAAGFAAAAATAADDLARVGELARLRDLMERDLIARVPGLMVAGAGAPRVAAASCLVAAGRGGEKMVVRLDLAGFAVSAGSACSSGKVKPSHVLAAMGFAPELAGSALRVSLGWGTTEDEALRFVDAYAACCAGPRRTV